MVLVKLRSAQSGASSSLDAESSSSPGGGIAATSTRSKPSTITREEVRAVAVEITDDLLVTALADGRLIAVPLRWFPRLARATPTQRQNLEMLGGGVLIHWPEVDEDIAVTSLLRV
jgi:hypothetical protein